MDQGPILVTERLHLRRLTPDDFDELYAMFNDAQVMRYYPGLKNDVETRSWLQWNFDGYRRDGLGLFALELLTDRAFVGQCGFIWQNVDGIKELEIGYLLKSRYWHQGYATEAACACRDFAFSSLGRTTLISLVRPENKPSRAVAERVGMAVEKETLHRNIRHLVYRINAPAAHT